MKLAQPATKHFILLAVVLVVGALAVIGGACVVLHAS